MVVSKQHEQQHRSYTKIGLARQGKPCTDSEISSIDSFCQQELFRLCAKTMSRSARFRQFWPPQHMFHTSYMLQNCIGARYEYDKAPRGVIGCVD